MPSPDKFTPAFCLNILFHSHLPTTTQHPLPPEPPPALKMASGHDLTFVWFLNLLFNKWVERGGGVCGSERVFTLPLLAEAVGKYSPICECDKARVWGG